MAEPEEGGEDNEDKVFGGVGDGVDEVDEEFCGHVAGTGFMGLNTSGPLLL